MWWFALSGCGPAEFSWVLEDPDGNPIDCDDLLYAPAVYIEGSAQPCSNGKVEIYPDGRDRSSLVAELAVHPFWNAAEHVILASDAVDLDAQEHTFHFEVGRVPLRYTLDFDTPSGDNCSGDGGVDTFALDQRGASVIWEDFATQFERGWYYLEGLGSYSSTTSGEVCERDSSVYLTFADLGQDAHTSVYGWVGDELCYEGNATFAPTPGDDAVHAVRVGRVADFEARGCADRTTEVTFDPVFLGYDRGAVCSGDPGTWGSEELLVEVRPLGEAACLPIPVTRGSEVAPTCTDVPCAEGPFTLELPDGDYTLGVAAFDEGAGLCNEGTLTFSVPGPTDLRFQVPATGDCEHPEEHELTIRPTWFVAPPLDPRTCDEDDFWAPVTSRRVFVEEAGDDQCLPIELSGDFRSFHNCQDIECRNGEAYTARLPEGRYRVTVVDDGYDGVECWRGEQVVDLTRSRELEVELTYLDPTYDWACRSNR